MLLGPITTSLGLEGTSRILVENDFFAERDDEPADECNGLVAAVWHGSWRAAHPLVRNPHALPGAHCAVLTATTTTKNKANVCTCKRLHKILAGIRTDDGTVLHHTMRDVVGRRFATAPDSPQSCVARRIEQSCHSLHLTVSWFSSSGFSHFPHTSTRLGVCVSAHRHSALKQETRIYRDSGCIFGALDGESGL